MTAATTPTAALAPTAAAVLSGLRAVNKGIERAPIPVDPDRVETWKQSHPAPRHVAALMQVVADEGMSISTLAARLDVSLATASQVVTDLEARDLVERVPDPTDRRRTLVMVSDSHRQLADSLLNTRLRPVQRALDRMRPAEQRALLRGLELVAEELGDHSFD